VDKDRFLLENTLHRVTMARERIITVYAYANERARHELDYALSELGLVVDEISEDLEGRAFSAST